jgi:prevent-host-death family protein
MAARVSYRLLRDNLAAFLKRVQEGDEIVVTVRGRDAARLVPPLPAARRPFGLLEGEIEMAPDFDRTPDEVITAMEGQEPEG